MDGRTAIQNECERQKEKEKETQYTLTQIGSLNYSTQKITNASQAVIRKYKKNCFFYTNLNLSGRTTNYLWKNETRNRSLTMHFKIEALLFSQSIQLEI